MSEENKKETAPKAVETPKSEEVKSTETPVVEEVKTEESTVLEELKIEEDPVVEGVKPKETQKMNVAKNEKVEEFDWDKAAQDDMYSAKERSNLEKEYAATLPEVMDKQVLDGTVVVISDREVVVDINFKSDGVISFNEFKYNPDLKAGDSVEVLVERQEDKNGQLVLSHKRARILRAWDKVNIALETGEVVNGQILSRTKGGMIVDVFGIECFLPGSQIDVKPIRDYDEYVGKKMEFKVVKVNEAFRNVVVSHKALIEADIEQQKKEIIKQLEKGQVLEGTVKNITSYGVFMDLGGVDGLIHITDLSWSRINHPSEIVELDAKINVVILDFDEDKSRIQLGLKQLSKHPWEALSDDVKVGDKVKGKVVVIADYGAFIELAEGVEGLVHVSEMSWSTHLRSAGDFVKVGDEIEAMIITFDREERKMSLGIKQLTPDPWTDITSKYPIGSKQTGTVRNFTNFGVFVELEEGIDGLIYISDLSWTKKIKHPSEFCAVGDKIEVVTLELDVENRKLSLGHKQTLDNPWDKYENEFTLNSVHTFDIFEIVDKGATVKFNDDITAFIPSRYLIKEDGSKLVKGESAEFKVIEFNKDSKRVVASHTSVFKDVEAENIKVANKKNKKEKLESKNTLGDANEKLQELKDKMDGK